MRVETRQTLAFESRVLQLSAPEMATLRAAARVAETAREKMRQELGTEMAEAHAYDLLLAEIEHNWRDFEDGAIELSSKESFLL